MSMLKGRDIHFRSIGEVNEKFGIHPLQALLRYGASRSLLFPFSTTRV